MIAFNRLFIRNFIQNLIKQIFINIIKYYTNFIKLEIIQFYNKMFVKEIEVLVRKELLVLSKAGYKINSNSIIKVKLDDGHLCQIIKGLEASKIEQLVRLVVTYVWRFDSFEE